MADGNGQLRHERVSTCAECGECGTGQTCAPARERLRQYAGIRFTSDGFDCALPVAIDSHSMCSFGCLYCFAPNLLQRREVAQFSIGQTSLRAIEAVFSGGGGREAAEFRQALKYDRRANGYPCPVQLGALCDPMDNIERQQGWLLKLIDLAVKYRQPVRISTKGRLGSVGEYLDAFAKAPELFWVAFSIITPDDALLAAIDRRAPSATERLQCMADLSRIGVKTSLRLRPILPGVSDCTPRYPQAYRELIERAAEAGACAISCEVAFVPGGMTPDVARRWARLEAATGLPLRRIYCGFGPRQACTRPAYTWTEHIMHAVRDEAHAAGLTVGVSDPVWKQLGDTGCCCGIRPDDPVFGNWQRESATHQFLEAQATGREITLQDVTPAWAHGRPLKGIVNTGVGPLCAWKNRHATWAGFIRQQWNALDAERGPLSYFQGALRPVRRDANGDLVYRFVGLKRSGERTPAPPWRVDGER